jgi:hypothetical protein
MPNQNQSVRQTAAVLMACGLIASLLPGFAAAQDLSTQRVRAVRAGAIIPLNGPVLAGKPVTFRLNGNPGEPHWDLGDGVTADGSSVTHTYQKPGIYRVVMGSKVGETFNEMSSAIVRVHTPETVHLPQVLLDTDARNEQDDQHYIAYALFSQLDVLCINSVHHNKWADETETQLVPAHSHWRGGLESETWNYDEIIKVLDLAKRSGLPAARVPTVFRGATEPLKTPSSKRWYDTKPIVTQASNAIVAAARGASPDNPVWVLPVGPCSNIASAILQVGQEGWETEFRKRIRVHWVGGSGTNIQADFNGRNDPWSTHVVYASGIEFLVLTAPASGLITVDKRVDGHRYPNNPLGDYLKQIMPINNKSLYDLGVPAIIISRHLGTSWIRRVEPRILVNTYEYQATTAPTTLNVVFEVDHEAIVDDFFNTVNGKPTALPPRRQKR